MKRVLITGPVERMGEWCRAAQEAGWKAIPFPLVDIVPEDVEPRAALGDSPAFDWICVTSANALPFVERALLTFPTLREAAIACVGDQSEKRLSELGLVVGFDPGRSAQELASLLAARAPAGARILWPRGNRSADLAVELRARGLSVTDPVVYSTLTRARVEPPPFEAVFFASPSGVHAWQEQHADCSGGRTLAIAIGPSTFSALLAETDLGFFDTLSLPQPEPATFGFVLQHLDPDPTP